MFEEKSPDYRDVVVFEKLRFQFVFRLERKASVFKFLPMKSVLEKLRFRDELVWAVGLTLKIQLYNRVFKFLRRSVDSVLIINRTT